VYTLLEEEIFGIVTQKCSLQEVFKVIFGGVAPYGMVEMYQHSVFKCGRRLCIVKSEVACSSEVLVPVYQITWNVIPEDDIFTTM
jgi:hypothetical protein